MLELSQMLLRLLAALTLGALMGLEREFVGKEAGIRTAMTVAGGAAIFTLIGLTLPYLLVPENPAEVISDNAGFLAVIANIVVGIGFLGAGIIIKTESRVHGLTTAAVVWATAAIGILAGLGIYSFAFFSTLLISGLLYLLRKLDISERIRLHKEQKESERSNH